MPRRKIRPNLDVDITWDDVQDKPSTFPPSSHNHDERYYTETELQTSGQSQVHWNNVSNKPSLITGSGTTNTIPKFTGTNAIGNSVIYENNGNVGIGTTTPSSTLDVVGSFSLNGVRRYSNNYYLGNSSNNKWYKVCTITITAQYNSCNIEGMVATEHGAYSTFNKTYFTLRVKQQGPLGSPPNCELFVNHQSQVSGFKAIITQNDSNAAVVTLYKYSPYPYSYLQYDIVQTQGPTITPTTSPIEGLGSGTEITPSGNFILAGGKFSIGGEALVDTLNVHGVGINLQGSNSFPDGTTHIGFGSNDYNSLFDIYYTGNTLKFRNSWVNMRDQFVLTRAGGSLSAYFLGGLNVGASNDPGNGNLYIVNNCSADSFTDRTKGYDGDALSEIKRIKNKDGEIDHDTLPEFVKKEIQLISVKEEDEREVKEVTVKQERDIGAMVTMLTVAIQQIADRLEKLEAKIK